MAQMGKQRHEFANPMNLDATNWPLKQLLIQHGDPSKLRPSKNSSATIYPYLLTSIAPVPHITELPVPTSSEKEKKLSEENSNPDYRRTAEPILLKPKRPQSSEHIFYSFKVWSWAFEFETQIVEFVPCKSQARETSPVFYKHFHSSR